MGYKMTNEPVVTKTFEEKLIDRLKNDIGDLMPDEVLSKLLEKAMDGVFFKPRVIGKEAKYPYDNKLTPSLFEETAEKLMRPIFEKAVNEFLDKNGALVLEKFAAILEQKGEDVAIMALSKIFNSPLEKYHESLRQRVYEIDCQINNGHGKL